MDRAAQSNMWASVRRIQSNPEWTPADVLHRKLLELQNRCPASLAMSGDGSFPSRPRQFQFELDMADRQIWPTSANMCLSLNGRSVATLVATPTNGLRNRLQRIADIRFPVSPSRLVLRCHGARRTREEVTHWKQEANERESPMKTRHWELFRRGSPTTGVKLATVKFLFLSGRLGYRRFSRRPIRFRCVSKRMPGAGKR